MPKRGYPIGWVTPAPQAKLPGQGIKAKRDRELYQAMHLAWSAGAIDDFYYGKRSPEDSTIVWELNGTERPRDLIPMMLEHALDTAGIATVEYGPLWCGYRATIVHYTDGTRATERYDGHTVIVEEVPA